MPAYQKACQHKVLQLEPSAFAELAGYERPDSRKRLAATTKSGRASANREEKSVETAATAISKSFPGPLVLPHDDLNYEPNWPPQSLRSWLHEKERNKPTSKRKTLYVAGVPQITPVMAFMDEWTRPKIEPAPGKDKDESSEIEDLMSPDTENFVNYFGAFYHGMPVKQFPRQLKWVRWKGEGKASSKASSIPKYVGLGVGDKTTRIRARPSPDGLFKGQLNLDDILDAAIDMLPDDAYSIILIVDHDIHEGEEDDFCCGRAYGGSRICVVQTARYHPILDKREKIDLGHMWPASHCKDYIDGLCAVEDVEPEPATKVQIQASQSGPIRAAISAASDIPAPSTTEDMRALWFARLARTAVHELGHCMGMDHCVYYACNMQGTAGMAEDGRQPPYLCPVCLGKISYAVACELQHGNEEDRKKYVRDRYVAIVEFCERWKMNSLFAGYRAWALERLQEIN
ncbi:hypothetical protein K505DRAFT_321663 [Melanomma pulvis-pyrius CBS 109.77]|uniref:Archaemetzincin-2 n=1 Tax=Melanomma pulvis-pyrius CBS 109.77 TaxID=1314802 RepID=A0A6A6XQT4_9PLEO|nr:hypothetical protein K505DRAFT_321663 [Melanomma pulvis-pyrius CBS 109.77]